MYLKFSFEVNTEREYPYDIDSLRECFKTRASVLSKMFRFTYIFSQHSSEIFGVAFEGYSVDYGTVVASIVPTPNDRRNCFDVNVQFSTDKSDYGDMYAKAMIIISALLPDYTGIMDKDTKLNFVQGFVEETLPRVSSFPINYIIGEKSQILEGRKCFISKTCGLDRLGKKDIALISETKYLDDTDKVPARITRLLDFIALTLLDDESKVLNHTPLTVGCDQATGFKLSITLDTFVETQEFRGIALPENILLTDLLYVTAAPSKIGAFLGKTTCFRDYDKDVYKSTFSPFLHPSHMRYMKSAAQLTLPFIQPRIDDSCHISICASDTVDSPIAYDSFFKNYYPIAYNKLSGIFICEAENGAIITIPDYDVVWWECTIGDTVYNPTKIPYRVAVPT